MLARISLYNLTTTLGKENMLTFLQTRRNNKLYNQWIKYAGLPPEEVPSDSPDEQSVKETGLANNNLPRERIPEYTATIGINRGMVHLPVRYVLLGLSVVVLLIVAFSVVTTVLVTQP